MNRDDILRMAREAGATDKMGVVQFYRFELEAFAALVAAAEREACQRVHDLLEVHQAALEASEKPGPWPSKEVIDKAVAAEREACARVCDDIDAEYEGEDVLATWCAAAIRERGEGHLCLRF